jgi:drug/metabolite transporter (DMT)-like permease
MNMQKSAAVRGIVMMCLSMIVFTALDAQAKYLTKEFPGPAAVFFRYAINTVIAVAVMVRSGSFAAFSTRHPGLQVFRGSMLMASTFLNFAAMYHLQLTQTAAIFFTIPLFVCVLSVPLLGERVGWRRWLAVLVGFLGVLVVMRPGSTQFHWAMFMSLGASLCGAFYNIATRKVGGHDSAETSVFYGAAVGTVGSAMALPWTWQIPHGWQWILLVGIGLAGAIGHYLLTQAHRIAPASLLAPFIYTQIIWMTLAGYVFFHDVPDMWTIIGAAIVVSSGLFVFARERKLGRETTVAPPVD